MVVTSAVPVKVTRGASIPLFRLFRSGMCSMPTVTKGVFQVYHICSTLSQFFIKHTLLKTYF
jgi:hypothetical protein